MPIIQRNTKSQEFSDYPPGHEEMSDAVNHDGYEYLQANAPYYLSAIEAAVIKGATPAEIKAYMSRLVGPDRQAMVKRCVQAAGYILKQQRDSYGETPAPSVGFGNFGGTINAGV